MNATSVPPIYAVTTPWGVHYSSQLRQALQAKGFHIIKLGDSLYDRTIGCDRARYPISHTEMKVKRGNVLCIGTDTYRHGEIEGYHRVERVLRTTYSFTEITLILTFALGTPISLIGVGFCGCFADLEEHRRLKRLKIKQRKRDQAWRDEKQRLDQKMAVPVGFDPENLGFRSPTIPKDSRLLQLPAEFHLELISHLHYHELQAISLTCRYFYHTVSVKYINISRWRFQLYQREEHQYMQYTGENIPCF